VFVPGKPFQPSLMFVGKGQESTKKWELLLDVPLGWAPAFLTNIRLGWKGLPETKHSSLFKKSVNYGVISFIVQAHGAHYL
jgi:hypothetical protein